MRLLAVLLVPAFIGLVTCQFNHLNPQHGGHNNGMVDRGTFAGGSSRNRGRGGTPYIPAPGPMQGGSRMQGGGMQGGMQQGGGMQGGMQGGVYHSNQGAAPVAGGSSRQRIPDYAPVQPGPMSGNVMHQNVGNGPAPDQMGGSSGLADIPLGPVQTDLTNNVNMVNQGAAPVGGNRNSGEVYYDYYGGANGGAAGGGANNAPQANPQPQGGNGFGNRNNQGYNGGAGGNSGNGGPAYAAGPYSDNAGQGAPLGGAAMNEFNQAASTGASSMGSTIAGVVCAVLVLVGIVAVAAVFLVRQRQSRMSIASV